MSDCITAPVSVLRRIDQLCDHFEEQWALGRAPRIEEYLRQVPDEERAELLHALLKVELELCDRKHRTTDLQDYLERFPAEQDVVRLVFADRCEPLSGEMVEDRAESDAAAKWQAVSHEPDAPDQTLSRAVVRLQVVDGPHKGQDFTFDRHDTLVAGRATAAQLRLGEDRHFSRYHFRLEVNPPSCFLADLGSRNGTYLNGRRVKECFLKEGDVISGGRTKIRVTVLVEPPRSEAEAEAAPLTRPPVTAKPAPPKATAEPSTLEIPGFDVLEPLGRGAMGMVYRAVRRADRAECAIKLMAPAQQTSEKAIQVFLREASLLSQLVHPHIVRFLEMGSAGGRLFFAMEHILKIDLAATLAPRPPEQRVRLACGLMCQVLSALEYAHARSLVHRDIKPANILVGRKGKRLHAWLADFGLAKIYTNAGFSQVTREGDICGSLPYMAPEQFINSRDARPACDLYSAGATLYRLLAGVDPHDFTRTRCKFLAILEDPPVPLEQRCPRLPAELVAIVHRALAKDPDERFASAAAMRHALLPFAR